MSDTKQTVIVTGKRPNDDDPTLVINGVIWSGWSEVRVTLGMERVPNDFELSLTEVSPDADRIDIKPGFPCEVWLGSRLKPGNRVITGYVDRYSASIGPHGHEVRIVGRGKCADLVDCSAEWPGGQIIANSVQDVAAKLAAPFGITVSGEKGPAVGVASESPLVPYLRLSIGENCWGIIDRLARIAGLATYELGDGNLFIAPNPGDDGSRNDAQAAGMRTEASSGFKEGVNIQQASATFSQDQRYSRYRIFRTTFDQLQDISMDGNQIAETVTDTGTPRHRPLDLIAEMGHGLSLQIAARRVQWEMQRRAGRSRMVSITTDSWRDSSGQLYAPNLTATVDIPSLKIRQVNWLITQVTFRKAPGSGTTCDLLMMPKSAFLVQPTVPHSLLPWDIAMLPNNPVTNP